MNHESKFNLGRNLIVCGALTAAATGCVGVDASESTGTTVPGTSVDGTTPPGTNPNNPDNGERQQDQAIEAQVHTVEGTRTVTLPNGGQATDARTRYEHVELDIYGCGPDGEISKKDLPDTMSAFYDGSPEKAEAHKEFAESLMGDNFQFLVENAFPNSFSDYPVDENDLMQVAASKMLHTDDVPGGLQIANYACIEDPETGEITVVPHNIKTLVNLAEEDRPLTDNERSTLVGYLLSAKDYKTWHDQMIADGFDPSVILSYATEYVDTNGERHQAMAVMTHQADCNNPFTVPRIPDTPTTTTTTPNITVTTTTSTIPTTTTIYATTTTTRPSTTTTTTPSTSTTTTTIPSTTTTGVKPPCDNIPGNDIPDCEVPDGPPRSANSSGSNPAPTGFLAGLTVLGLFGLRKRGGL